MADLEAVGVVIVTYNSAGVVAAALDALPRDLIPRTVVVDNASSDDTLEVIGRRPAEARPGLVASEANLGFSAGVNLGVAQLSEATYLLVLNPDALLGEADLHLLVDYLDEHPTCGVVSPRLWTDGQPLTSARRVPGMLTELWPFAPASVARHLPTSSLPLDYATPGPVGAVEGACMLVRASSFRSLGGFDEGYFLFFEELDLAMRLRRAGLTADLCPDAHAQHRIGHSRDQVAFGAAPHFVTSTLRFFRTWLPRHYALMYVLLARPCWWLRSRYGGLDPDLAASFRDALTAPGARP